MQGLWGARSRYLFQLLHSGLVVLALCATFTALAQDASPEMKPIKSRHTAAWKAARHFQHGVNLANFLEVPPGQRWNVPHSVEDLKEIREQGFDHIRVPVCWHRYCGPGPDYTMSNAIYDRVDGIMTNALALKLNVIINIHNFNELTTDPAANTAWFYAVWRQVAAHYAKAPSGVAFELLNEPTDAATTQVMNPLYAEAIREIRQTNPRRTIFAGPGRWNSADELTNFYLPDDKNIIVTLHCYEPFFFTHQGATWTHTDVNYLHGIHFPGPPVIPYEPAPDADLRKWTRHTIEQYNTQPTTNNPSSPKAFLSKIAAAKAWSDKWGRPIHFGEFGALSKADQPSRAKYYAAMRQALESAGFGWAIWDWKSGFNYWDAKKHEPLPGMREALFPGKNSPAK
jgi:endoglucanase